MHFFKKKKVWIPTGIIVLVLAFLVLSGEEKQTVAVPDEVSASIYTASEDGTAHKVNEAGQQDWIYARHGDAVTGVTADAAGNAYTASVVANAVDKVTPAGDQAWTYRQHSAWARDAAVDADGNVYTASDDSEVHGVSPTGQQRRRYGEHTDAVLGVATDGEFVYTASRDGEVHKVNAENGEQVWEYTGHEGQVKDVAVGPDGAVYTASADNEHHKINSNGERIWRYDVSGSLQGVAVHEGRTYVVGNTEELHAVNAENGERIWRYTEQIQWINDVAVDRAGFIYTAGDSGKVHKVNHNGEQVWVYEEHNGSVLGVAVSPAE